MSNEEIKHKINGFLDAQKRKRIAETIITALLTCAAIAFGATSCKALRTITTTSSFVQTNDSSKTATTISTKTVEEYRGQKK